MDAERSGRRIGALALAFAAGCLPSARLVARLMSGRSIEELGDGKPGASNVYRSLGPAPGVAVMALDTLKAFAPAAALHAGGAADGVVAAAAVAPVAAHVTVVGGQGVGAALGAALVLDAPTTLVVVVPIVGATVLGYSPQAVLAGALIFPVASGLRRRRWAVFLWASALPIILIAARLRGRPGGGPPLSARMAFDRLLLDRDE